MAIDPYSSSASSSKGFLDYSKNSGFKKNLRLND
jgi:hypothetical protein